MPDGAATSAGPGADSAVTADEARLLRGVRVNLALWSGGITLAVLVVLGIVLYVAVDRSLSASGTAELVARASQLTRGRPNPDDELPPGGFNVGGRGSGTFTLIVDAAGRPVGQGRVPIPVGLPVMASIDAARDDGSRDIREAVIAVDAPGGGAVDPDEEASSATSVRVLTEPVAFRGQQFYLQIVGDRTAEVRTLRILALVLVVGGLAALLVASGVGAAYASRALVPIRRSLTGQREALRRQREFAADASHELRTPLTVIRASVEDLERHAAEPVATVGTALTDIRDEVDHLAAMVEDLLLLARSDSGALEIERLPVDLGDIASSGAGALAKVAADRGVSVTVDPEPAEISGDPARLRQLVVILVDNALRHAPDAGSVAVRVRVDGPDAVLVVDDDGPGIRAEDLPRLFDRFYRATGAPGQGTGLGLAIAAWIVERHGGRIAASERPGGGARFTVRIPRGRTGGPAAAGAS